MKTKLYLHIAKDEKFIDVGYSQLNSSTNDEHKLYVVSENKELKFVKSNCTIVSRKELNTLLKKKLVASSYYVILHSLISYNLHLKRAHRVLWIGWGYDYYDFISGQETLLLNNTKDFLYSRNKIFDKLKVLLKYQMGFLSRSYYLIKKRKQVKWINHNIDYFAPVLRNEYSLIKNRTPNFKPKFIDWNYGSIENFWVKNFMNLECIGNNVLLGNSASLNNNHIDLINELTNVKDQYEKVIVPLTYGDVEYANWVINKGKSTLGNAFHPLTEHLEVSKYLEVILTCSTVIMPHLRQQAIGNILMALYLGASVFLWKSNPAYTFFKNLGVQIFAIDDLIKGKVKLTVRLTESEIKNNRRILIDEWGLENINRKSLHALFIISGLSSES